MTSVGVKMFARGCTSLSHFRCNVTTANSMCKHMRVNGPYIKALAESKSLHVLSLLLGSKNRADALASLQLHPALRELNLFSTGYSDVSLDVHLPFLKRLRLYRQARSANFWRDFFQALCKGGNGGNGGTVPNPLCNLPNLQFLLINFAHRHNNNFNSPMLQLLSPGVQAALPRSKLVSIVVRPCTDEQLSQWQALGPLNSLGQPISLKKGKKWPWGREGKGHWYRAQI
ncbi:hypothetical protein B484DRAFT_201490 [Ochromonadaceae sp. CCMP2298]|nr:hypothetical protein B484DRAFT_201490 [Ochromonadaceae sp. CCMP2298]